MIPFPPIPHGVVPPLQRYSKAPEHLSSKPLFPTTLLLTHIFYSTFYISNFISYLLLFNKAPKSSGCKQQ